MKNNTNKEEMIFLVFMSWIISVLILFGIYEAHYHYSIKLLGEGYWIGWNISWELFLSVTVFFISSLLLSHIKTRYRFIYVYLTPLIFSIIVFINIPNNYYAKFFDGHISAFEETIRFTTYPLCLSMVISHILWVNQEVKFYCQQNTPFWVLAILILISSIAVTYWSFLELISGF